MAEEKEPLKGLKKYILGIIVFAVGVAFTVTGNVELGKYLIGFGIAIAVGGNVYDHQRNKKKE